MKFILFLEGTTKAKGVHTFINRWLNQFFAVGVGVQPDTFEGWPDLHDRAPKKAEHYLTNARSPDVVAVVSLLDLYGPTFYPADITGMSERHAWGTEYMEGRVRQHFRDKNFRTISRRSTGTSSPSTRPKRGSWHSLPCSRTKSGCSWRSSQRHRRPSTSKRPPASCLSSSTSKS